MSFFANNVQNEFGSAEPTQPLTWQMLSDLKRDWSESVKLNGDSVDAHNFFQLLAEQSNQDFTSDSDWLNRWVALFDHILFFHYLIYSCYLRDVESTDSVRTRCFHSLHASIFDDLYSIRILIAQGRELATRKILRSVAEYFEMEILLYLEPSLAASYFEAHYDDGAANNFWHKVVSKGKSKKQIENALGEESRRIFYSVVRDYNDSENAMLGQLIHPSYVSCVFTFFPPVDAPNIDGCLPFRYAHDFSVRTLKHVIALTLGSIFLLRDFPFRVGGDSVAEILQFDAHSELHLSAQTAKILLLKHLQKVFLDTNEFFEVAPDQDMSRA